MNTPESIKPHAADYVDNAWEQYTFSELGDWIHLLVTRAGHRSDPLKHQKDLYDAQNYASILQAKLDNMYPHVPRTRPREHSRFCFYSRPVPLSQAQTTLRGPSFPAFRPCHQRLRGTWTP